jgi:hypothetical protein
LALAFQEETNEVKIHILLCDHLNNLWLRIYITIMLSAPVGTGIGLRMFTTARTCTINSNSMSTSPESKLNTDQ